MDRLIVLGCFCVIIALPPLVVADDIFDRYPEAKTSMGIDKLSSEERSKLAAVLDRVEKITRAECTSRM